MKKIKPTKRAMEQFEYFTQCTDTKRIEPVASSPDGLTAAECFYSHETYGKIPPCREPELLARALNGKEWHGLTVTMVAEDYVGRITFAEDLKHYPAWVRKDILGRASQIAMNTLGFVPTFVRTGDDLTTLLIPGDEGYEYGNPTRKS